MEKIVKNLNEKIVLLTKELDEYNNLKLKRDILREIIGRIGVRKTYRDVKNDLMYMETSLSIIYPEKEACEYTELLMMILAGLIQCEEDFYIHSDYYHDFQNKLKQFVERLNNEYENAKKAIQEISITKKRGLIDRIKRILKYIDNNYYTDSNLKEIRRVLKELNYDDEEIILFLEKCQVNSDEKEADFTIIDLFNYKFAYIEPENVSFENRNLINSLYYNILAKVNEEFSLTILTSLLLELSNYPLEIKKGVIQKLLDYFKLKYQENKVLFYDEEFYFSKEFKNELISECQMCIGVYELLVEEYQRISSEEFANNESLLVNRRLLLARSGDVTHLERDIKNLDKEILESAGELLRDINDNNPLITFKKLVGFDDLYEFKYNNHHNQLRVVVKCIKGNIYAIVGIIQKKETWGNKQFGRVDKRIINTKNIEQDLKNYAGEMDSIYKYIEENKRKGIRK